MKRITENTPSGRAIHELMSRLVEGWKARMPDVEEADIRRELWAILREYAELDDPNHLTHRNRVAAVWVLTSLLEMEALPPLRLTDRSPDEGGTLPPAPGAGATSLVWW